MKFNIIFILMISFLAFKCEKSLVNPSEEVNGPYNFGKLSLNLNLSNAPTDVVYLNGQLTRIGYDTIDFDFDVQNEIAQAQVENITIGEWHLVINAYNNSAQVIYSGSTNVNILPNSTVNVELHLKPTTGRLEITVTWGDEENIVFYDLDQNIYMISGVENSPNPFARGVYPFWFNSKSKIGFNSPNNFNFYIFNATTKEILKTYDITGYGTFTFGRYSEALGIFLFAVNHHGQPSIGLMDIDGKIEIISRDYPIYNPVCSGVDDWIYHLNNADGTRDISRMKPDGSLDEPITNSQEFKYSNFSVSFDGNYIAVPKFNDEFHYIAIIDTKTKEERLIDLTDLNLVGFTSFSEDNKYIFFTGGDRRDLYQINFDGTNLKQLTNKTERFYRPLSW